MSSTTDYDDSIEVIAPLDCKPKQRPGHTETPGNFTYSTDSHASGQKASANNGMSSYNHEQPKFIIEDVEGNIKSIYTDRDSIDTIGVQEQALAFQEDYLRDLCPSGSVANYLAQEEMDSLSDEDSKVNHLYSNEALADESIHQQMHRFLHEEDNLRHICTYGAVTAESSKHQPPRFQDDEYTAKYFLTSTSGYFSDESSQPPTTSGTQICLIPEALDQDQELTIVVKRDKQTPKQRKMAKLIFTIAGVLILAGFVLVGVTLSMSHHIDHMVKQMQGTTLPPPLPSQNAGILNVTDLYDVWQSNRS